MPFLASFLVSLAVGLLKAFLAQRQERMDTEEWIRLRVAINDLEGVTRALAFKADAARNPADAAVLGVRESDKIIELRRNGPTPHVPPDGP